MKMAVSMVSVFRGVPSIWGLSWPLPGLLLASCWLQATRISLENRFLGRLAKTVNSLHENGCFSMVSVFRGVPPNLGPLPGFFLASCWPLAGFLLALSFPTRISLENRFLGRLAKTVNSLHENGCFSMVSVFRGVPPIWGLLLASWPLAGLLLASCWFLAGLLLASCWLAAGFLLASCWPLPGLLLASCWLQASPRGFL